MYFYNKNAQRLRLGTFSNMDKLYRQICRLKKKRKKEKKKRGSISDNGNSNEKMNAFHCCNKKTQITTKYETGTALYSLNLSVLCGVEGS